MLKFLFRFGSFYFPLNRKYSVLFPVTFTFFISTPAKSAKGTQEPPFPFSLWEYSYLLLLELVLSLMVLQ